MDKGKSCSTSSSRSTRSTCCACCTSYTYCTNNIKRSPEPIGSGLFGAEGGIRTHAGVNPNGFQDRLVMTTSIPLHIQLCASWRSIILTYVKGYVNVFLKEKSSSFYWSFYCFFSYLTLATMSSKRRIFSGLSGSSPACCFLITSTILSLTGVGIPTFLPHSQTTPLIASISHGLPFLRS